MEILGIALLSQIDTSSYIDASQYAFQIIAGTGTGLVNSGLILLVPYAMDKRDLGKLFTKFTHDCVQGFCLLTTTSRWLSSYIAVPHLGRSSRYRHRYIYLHTLHSLPSDRHPTFGACRKPARERTELVQTLSPETLERVRQVFGEAYNLQVKVLIGFAVAKVPVTGMMWTNLRVESK